MRYGNRPVFCSRADGSIQRAARLSAFNERASSPGVTIEASRSPQSVDAMRIFPRRKVNNARLATVFVCSFVVSLPLFPLFKMLHGQ